MKNFLIEKPVKPQQSPYSKFKIKIKLGTFFHLKWRIVEGAVELTGENRETPLLRRENKRRGSAEVPAEARQNSRRRHS